jgi:hypothetical protein
MRSGVSAERRISLLDWRRSAEVLRLFAWKMQLTMKQDRLQNGSSIIC